jgi:DNA-binding beta-propeller fold protein YncE
MKYRLLMMVGMALASAATRADDYIPPVVGGRTWVQHLIEVARVHHPEIQSVVVTGKREGSKDPVILGSTLGASSVFQKATDTAAQDGAAPSNDGHQFVIREAFLSSTNHRLGTLELRFGYQAGQATAPYQATAKSMQAGIAAVTLSGKNAVDPYPYDAAWSPDTYAQKLTEDTVQKHPELIVMMIHATPPGSKTNIIIGSNIGRIGKVADEDDLRIIQTGATNLEMAGDGDRFETAMPLLDAAGKQIGALGLVFAFGPGKDKEALHARGRAIRDELGKQIPNSAALFQPASRAAGAPAAAARKAPLTLSGSTDFPGYKGDFDHFAIGTRDGRLFLAGEESAELEVMDLQSGAIRQRIKGFGVPHSLHYMADTNELLVIDGEKPSQVFDAATLKAKRAYRFAAGADSFGFDPSTGHIWLVTGGKDVPQKDSNLTEIDPRSGKQFANVHFDADHVEAMVVDAHGPHIYVNVTDKNYLAVVDKNSGKIRQWKISEAEQNAPLAWDDKYRRLFVVTRKPGKLLVLNADNGATVASFSAPARTDQVVWDAANRRVYVTGGEGYISVIEQDDADHYRDAAKIPSMAGAKTAILDAAHGHLWVAASPGETGAMGKVLRFDVTAR